MSFVLKNSKCVLFLSSYLLGKTDRKGLTSMEKDKHWLFRFEIVLFIFVQAVFSYKLSKKREWL